MPWPFCNKHRAAWCRFLLRAWGKELVIFSADIIITNASTPLEVQPRSVLAKERMLGEAPPAICLSPELKKLPATYFISHIAYETREKGLWRAGRRFCSYSRELRKITLKPLTGSTPLVNYREAGLEARPIFRRHWQTPPQLRP